MSYEDELLKYHQLNHRMYFVNDSGPWLVLGDGFFALLSLAKTFQNRSVSSALALATVSPSGLAATWSILSSWPHNFAREESLDVDGSHDHTAS